MPEQGNLDLIIRVDANKRMGAGHLMRCLALGQAWRENNGQVTFLLACDSSRFLARLRGEGFTILRLPQTYPDPNEWERTQRTLASHPDAWVVVDGYHFDTGYQQRIMDAGHPLLVIDDTAHLNRYAADLLLNQNIHAESLSYRCEPDCRMLLGTEYAMLRREFLSWKGMKREIPDVARRMLVTLGDADVYDVMLLVLEAIQRLEIHGLETTFVMGAGMTHRNEVKRAVRRSTHPVHLLHDTDEMPRLMARADLALSGGGSTSWELAFMQLPSLVLVLAGNQEAAMTALDAQGSIRNLGWHSKVDAETLAKRVTDLAQDPKGRAEMSGKGRSLVDGMGGMRVVRAMGSSRSWRSRLLVSSTA